MRQVGRSVQCRQNRRGVRRPPGPFVSAPWRIRVGGAGPFCRNRPKLFPLGEVNQGRVEDRMSDGWPFHPKNFAMIMAVVFFAILIALVVCDSGLPQPPSWYLTGTPILAVPARPLFTPWPSLSTYQFITQKEQCAR